MNPMCMSATCLEGYSTGDCSNHFNQRLGFEIRGRVMRPIAWTEWKVIISS